MLAREQHDCNEIVQCYKNKAKIVLYGGRAIALSLILMFTENVSDGWCKPEKIFRNILPEKKPCVYEQQFNNDSGIKTAWIIERLLVSLATTTPSLLQSMLT